MVFAHAPEFEHAHFTKSASLKAHHQIMPLNTPLAPSLSRRFSLREGTWAMHQKLDSCIGHLTTPSAYKRYLFTVFTLRSGIEHCLQHSIWPAYLGSWRPSYLTEALQQDMQDLSLASTPMPMFPPLTSHSALLGALYVIEGASLGARLLIKQAATLGFTGEFGARHLAQQTAGEQEWSIFLHYLDNAPDFQKEQAIHATQAVFSYALDALKLVDQTLEGHQHG